MRLSELHNELLSQHKEINEVIKYKVDSKAKVDSEMRSSVWIPQHRWDQFHSSAEGGIARLQKTL